MEDEYVDVTPWLAQKWSAISSHTSQLEGERSLPALLARLDQARRDRILSTEYFTRTGAPLCFPRSCKRAAGLRARHDCSPLSNG
ncbi:hypothetical protein AB0N14_38585 [Streptomyces sp. NPDC051104]|uniref:hypothetical protein n=1 Tax=Streptomyces sp. NPDC051104 TaxID=3155044 RepID=UPI003432ABDB